MEKLFNIKISEGYLAEAIDSLNELAELLEGDEERINDLREIADLLFAEAKEQGYMEV